jgi:hypothetical protein
MKPACEHSHPRCVDCEAEANGITTECRWIADHSPVNGRERIWVDEWPVLLLVAALLALAALLRLVNGDWLP